jgi:hypothetical protein
MVRVLRTWTSLPTSLASLAASSAAMKTLGLLGRRITLGLGRLLMAERMSSTLGFWVCPPATTRAPRERKARATPCPRATATRPVGGGASSKRPAMARISVCCSDMSSTLVRTMRPKRATVARRPSGSSVWTWPFTYPSAPTTRRESPKGGHGLPDLLYGNLHPLP